ncbi:type II toxin-antitoxin system Phd/YefM family antitoxin [Spiractinospora alimapuensis]|uniref:type II toxin-antitoxin system Phd/YefM family antitoxin n=1 Tax=Spiractinospora alimapuensis TaxID=2820884 RepID=UPI001F2556E1|nr:type II toxin-antitoxin system Phd/YefM family antitoxin [Spiractinospora alimapuensis]QVQ50124.1 type II toxin-antitoxin system Phd/YefM family antitoxin [Spiractinospora alimapuensis]
MAVTASELRRNVYQLLDEVLTTGAPLEIERGGQTLYIIPGHFGSKVDRLESHPGAFAGDPEDFVHLDWSGEWEPES